MDENLAQDLVSMWQSELTAMAADRELRESWAAMVALWAHSSSAAWAVLAHERAARSASPAEPARPAPAAAASQPGLGEVEQLERRVAELEQILARLLGPGPGGGGPGGDASGV
jgi:hypothetical protein